ncbi:urocortin-3 [Dasypus novemcinctus]|uniref:urocortin-3 n=1 Tax=Dasypus novemcinctus TaxID=9361 RepID=UPI00265E042D|nr:urocortin-3 [Dasypus novemcinctus]
MLMPAHFLLLLLLLLGAPKAGLSHNFYKAESIFSCINTALSEAKKSQLEDAPLLSKRSFHYLPSQDPSSGEEDGEEEDDKEDREKRTFPSSGGRGGAGSTRYKYLLSQAQLREKLYQDKAKSDQHTKFTLSLDVPTNIMNILFNIAKAKNLRAKAAANAHLMAQIGRKK